MLLVVGRRWCSFDIFTVQRARSRVNVLFSIRIFIRLEITERIFF